jgi:hypothetical protein
MSNLEAFEEKEIKPPTGNVLGEYPICHELDSLVDESILTPFGIEH